jgi:hypothetical protein
MVNACGIFIFYIINDRAFRAVHNFIQGTLDHFSHFTLFKFLKLFAKKTQYPELRNYRAMGIPAG